MTEQTGNTKPIQNDEIDLIEVFKKIWAGQKSFRFAYISKPS